MTESLVRLLVLFLFFATASAEASQFARCSTYLLSARAKHFTEGFSEQYTQAAFQELNEFRMRYLREFDHSPANLAVMANESSSESLRRAVDARISGLLTDRTIINQSTSRGIPMREKIYGTVFNDSEIHEELQARGDLRRSIDRMPEIRSSQPIPLLGASLYTAMATIATVALSVHPQPLGITAAVLALYFTKKFPEISIRYLYDSFGPSADEKRVFKAVRRAGADIWSYRSFDTRIPAELVQKIWNTNEADELDYRTFLSNFNSPRLIRSIDPDRYLNPMVVGDDPPDGWLRVDEFVTQDAFTREPKLITFLRISEKLPIYPKPAQARERSSQTVQTSYGPIQVPIQVR